MAKWWAGFRVSRIPGTISGASGEECRSATSEMEMSKTKTSKGNKFTGEFIRSEQTALNRPLEEEEMVNVVNTQVE